MITGPKLGRPKRTEAKRKEPKPKRAKPGRKKRQRSASDAEIDAHIGLQIKHRRAILGMSQMKLGAAIGLTFQQVQKYERGTNRVGGSMLWRLSKVLAVPPSYFFDGLGAITQPAEQIGTTRRVMSLAAALAKLPEAVQIEMGRLATALAEAQPTAGGGNGTPSSHQD